MQLVLTPSTTVMVILKEISFNCGSFARVFYFVLLPPTIPCLQLWSEGFPFQCMSFQFQISLISKRLAT